MKDCIGLVALSAMATIGFCIVMLILGSRIGIESAVTACDRIGTFYHDGRFYQCSLVEEKE